MTELTGAQPSEAAHAAGQALWKDGWTLNVTGPLATYVTTITDLNGSVSAKVEAGPFGVRTLIHGGRHLAEGWDLSNPLWQVEAGHLPATLIEAVLRVGSEFEDDVPTILIEPTVQPLIAAGWRSFDRLVDGDLVPRAWHTPDCTREVRWHDGIITADDDFGWRIERNDVAGTILADPDTPRPVIAALALLDL